jgi:4-hydroxythreonine-4-phosphate dehydrogenase
VIARQIGLDVPVREIAAPAEAAGVFGKALPVLAVKLRTAVRTGHPDPANAPATIESIERAAAFAKSGGIAGVVTNPIQKKTLQDAGFKHPGHTEFLAELAGGIDVAMMLACPELRVVPVTIHLALAQAVQALDSDSIVRVGRIAAAGLKSLFGIEHPRLAVAGLNPHAGEHGLFGDEERTAIRPAIDAGRARGIDVSGPYPGDTVFVRARRGEFDVVIACYHDQGLIPVKLVAFGQAVNVTLGLPIIRTSVDHGTAFDIAGKGVADPESMITAVLLAARLARPKSEI